MTLRHLKIFRAVAQTGSITKAAQQLYLSQPSVSVAVKELEKYYGIRFFERLNQRLKITEDGVRFLNYVTHIIDLFEEVDKSFRTLDSPASIRLGASVTLGACFLPLIMRDFSVWHPADRLYLRVASSGETEKAVLENELDLAVIEGVVHSEYIVSEPLAEDRLIAVCSREHPYAGAGEVPLAEFVKQPILLRERTSGTSELFQTAIAAHGFTVSPVMESTSIEALKNAAAENVGIAVLPEQFVKAELSSGRLNRVAVRNFSVKRCFQLIRHKNKYLSRPILALMETIRNTIAKL